MKLENINLKSIRVYDTGMYDEFFEFEFDNGEFALLNTYITEVRNKESYTPENFAILKQSVIDELKKDDDDIWEGFDKYLSDNTKYIDEQQECFDKELYDCYRDLIINALDMSKNFSI